MNIVQLKDKKIGELALLAKDFKIDGAAGMRKQDLIFALLQAEIERTGLIFGEGTLEILPDGFGFLRAPNLITCRDRMIFMSLPHRYVVSI